MCGQSFNKKKKAQDHVQIYAEVDNAWPHQIVKRKWRARWISFLIHSRSYWKFTGVMIIYFTILNHFGISVSLWEGLAMGCGLGLAIDW